MNSTSSGRGFGRLVDIIRYPVKSMQGEPIDQGQLAHDGLEGDRTFAVHDLDTGKIASAKQPRHWRALLDCRARGQGDNLVVQLPDGPEHKVTEPALTEQLAHLTGRHVRLQRAQPGRLGSYDSTWPLDDLTLTGNREFPMALTTDAVRFVDVAALHVITTATLARLEQLSPRSTATPRRFRPNLVIDTGDVVPAFHEDTWVGQTLRIGPEAEIRITLRTPRCVMTTVEQDGLPHDPDVLRAAANNRHRFPNVGTQACAGVYAEITTPGPIALGDPIYT